MANTLIPFWDMANHDNGELSTDFDDEKDCTLCMAHKDFELGQQFTIFYGVRANIDLLGTIHILRTHYLHICTSKGGWLFFRLRQHRRRHL